MKHTSNFTLFFLLYRLEHEDYVLDKKEKSYTKREKKLVEESSKTDLFDSYKKWDLWQAKKNAEDRREEVESKRKSMEEVERQRAMQMGCHDKSKERAIFEMSNEEKFENCRIFKTEGMTYFREGQFFRSCASFRKITVYLTYTFPEDEKEQKIYDDLLNSSELNMAACKLKTQNYPEAIRHCTTVLRSNSKCVRALLRRARAYRLTDHFDKASEDLSRVMKIEPSNEVLLQEQESLKGQMRGYEKNSKRIAGAMFRR